MYSHIFQAIALTNHWPWLWPEIALTGIGIVLLVGHLCVPERQHRWLVYGALGAQVLLLSFMAGFFTESWMQAPLPNCAYLLLHTNTGNCMRMFFVLCSLLVGCLSVPYFAKQRLPRIEFLVLVMLACASLMVLVQSNHFVTFFVALETASVAFYALVSYCRYSSFSLEAGLKYLVLSSLSAATLLLGIVFLYGVSGNPELPAHVPDGLQFQALEYFLQMNAHNRLSEFGVILVVCGIAFKVGAFPFHIWVSDVYQGAPTPTTALLAIASKAAGIVVLMVLVNGPFLPMAHLVVPLLSAMIVTTLLFASFAATSQRNVKRLMGLSGIAHAGYLMLGVLASLYVPWAWNAVLFYLFTYLLATGLSLGVMTHLAPAEDHRQTLGDYQLLWHQSPFLATVLCISLGSLAGIPPLAGFIGKLLLFIAAFQAKLYLVLGFAVVGVVVSVYYYFNWIRELFFVTLAPGAVVERISTPTPLRYGFILLAATLVALGFFQGGLGELITHR